MFYVSTTWKHKNKIDNEKMQRLLGSFKGTNPNVKEVHWWKIDDYTHYLLCDVDIPWQCPQDIEYFVL